MLTAAGLGVVIGRDMRRAPGRSGPIQAEAAKRSVTGAVAGG